MLVTEIFGPTIQGEGPWIGKKCIFVRFYGCDYKCYFCDQKENIKQSTDLTINNILNKIISLSKTIKKIVITGGNPCIQDKKLMKTLIELLLKNNYEVAVETQGSIWCDWLSLISLIVVSPKLYCYNSKNFKENFMNIYNLKKSKNSNLCIKIVVFKNRYLKKQIDQIKQIKQEYPHFPIYISIGNRFTNLNLNDNTLKLKILDDYKKILLEILKEEELNDIFILPQMHVLIWGHKKGV